LGGLGHKCAELSFRIVDHCLTKFRLQVRVGREQLLLLLLLLLLLRLLLLAILINGAPFICTKVTPTPKCL